MIEARILHRVRGFTLDVDFASEGPVLGIFGPSGAGKTSLLHALAGFHRPQEARIAIEGEELTRRPGGRSLPPEARRLAIVPQDPLLFPHLSTRRNLEYAPGARVALSRPEGRRIVEVLRLEPLMERATATLSGGERQRVALGRALLARPRLLLLDEPSASLDAELGREVLSLLLEIKRELRIPMIFITHRASELLALADDCLVLDRGRVTAQGAPLEVLARPAALSVANLLGVDNLLRLEVLRHDEEGGVTSLSLGGDSELVMPLGTTLPGESVDVGIYAEDVILCRRAPEVSSARNALEGRVVSLDPVGHEILVTLEIGDHRFRVRITPAAARDLETEVGQKLVALIKSTACHYLS